MKPMLAAKIDDASKLTYPLLASPKLDGIRAIVYKGKLVSRNLKPIPNKFIQNALPWKQLEGIDGELIIGDPKAEDCFRKTTSGVMSEDGEPDFVFWLFDKYDCEKFDYRYALVKQVVKHMKSKRLKAVGHITVRNAEELAAYEEVALEEGYEGVMLRHPLGLYKQGRSTFKEGHLMKLKRFADSEAKIIRVDELEHNNNELTKDNLGRAKRSSHKAGKVGGGVMGALGVQDIKTGVKFDIGAGFKADERERLWKDRKTIIGHIIKYKYFPTGSKDKPRFPVFLGFRSKLDM